MTENHISFLKEAIRLSELSVEHGNEPFGAVLVYDDEIILTAENTIYTEKDVTCHAELNLIRKASKLDVETRSKCTLYTSTEPCAMCATEIYWAGIHTIVYACPEEKLAEFKGSDFRFPSREVFARGKRETQVIGPILEEEAVRVYHKFWKKQKSILI